MPSNSKEYDRDYYLKHREEKRERHNRASLEYYSCYKKVKTKKQSLWNKEYIKQYQRQYLQKCRIEVLTHYGRGKMACVQCGESRLACLSIDHINGNGALHRRQINRREICRWLKTNNYPEGYQTLCMNCQWVKRVLNFEGC